VRWSGGGTFLSLAAWAALGRHPENASSTALWQGLVGAGGTGTCILVRLLRLALSLRVAGTAASTLTSLSARCFLLHIFNAVAPLLVGVGNRGCQCLSWALGHCLCSL
jgi:hypothetical protein